MKKWIIIAVILAVLGIAAIGGYYVLRRFLYRTDSQRHEVVWSWLTAPQDHQDWAIQANQRCGAAPFQYPTNGLIGYLWDDSFRPGHRHSGLDIFGGKEVGETPVYAAYDAYLTREADWKSTVILRVPEDPLQPDRQIWLYYTHMAHPDGTPTIAPEFPPDTHEVFVPAGTLLGHQGNYSGDPLNPTGIHLHFSIVLDDGQGNYLNELEITNTLDPSPYFNLPLNANTNPNDIPTCEEAAASAVQENRP